ncbi:Release factor glutamine methyltransferase [Planctomycetes bacterium Pan216]|uniref:Release factor glutamine methyltransferase n=1 Tax=Kolteria novifilia TaxID=2527975 RepID=A0A518B7H0_9BACT|nr:Release factor glutamine methyltransferase [Planctomycetes bacterium Pan216]
MEESPGREDVWTIGRLLGWTTSYFQQKGFESPRLDAECLLSHVLDCPRISLYTLFAEEVNEHDRGRFRELVRRRAERCPTAYLTGVKEFFSLSFVVNEHVLIPRPATEYLVIEALAFAAKRPVSRFLDLGTGSGVLAITLARELGEARGWAVDLSSEALAVARGNAERLEVAERVTFVESDLLAALDPNDRFDLIVSNPPYVSDAEWERLEEGVRRFEPELALKGGPDGLRVIERIMTCAPSWLHASGRLMLEVGAGQDQAVVRLATSIDGLSHVATVKDHEGHSRVIVLECTRASVT